MKKRKFSIIDFFISILFTLFISYYFLPQSINYLISRNKTISYSLKQEIILAGKKYLNNNMDINSVSLVELVDSGYLSRKKIFNKDCFLSISTINRNNSVYSLNLKCIGDDSKLTLLE